MSRVYTNCQVSGNQILLKEIEDGKRKRYRVDYKPTLYVSGKPNSTWHTLSGLPVEPLQFGSIKEAREFVKMNGEVKDYPLYGNTMFQYAFISDEYPEHEIHYNINDICIISLDIECESESGFTQDAAQETPERINVITIKEFGKDMYYVFTILDGDIYNSSNCFVPKSKNITHYEYDSEAEMLQGFLTFWRKLDPDIVTGWNSRFFDIPYIYNRIVMLFDEKMARKLSPWGQVQEEIVNFMMRDHKCYAISGISQLDYLQIYRKNVLDPRENYKLDHITKVELGEGKVDWREKYDTMKEFYHKDFQWFVEYNIQDVRLIEMLEKKRSLINLIVNVAYMTKTNYVDVLAQTRIWDVFIYNWLKEEKIVIPQKEFQFKNDQFVGAYVKDPLPGLYNNVVSFDVASLYPNIIRVLNIGPETKNTDHRLQLTPEDYLNETDNWEEAFGYATSNNCSIASNGVFYSKEKLSFYSRMVATLFTNRKKYQAEVKKAKSELENCADPKRKEELGNIVASFDIKQKATKIMMNSLYGAFGSQYFRYYDLDNAVAVTATGQFIIQYIQQGINEYFNDLFKTDKVDFVIYSDTDSVYVSLDKITQHVFKGKKIEKVKLIQFMDKICKDKLEPKIDKLFENITHSFINGMRAEKPILSMKREVISDRSIFASKKHYILQVWNSEGENYYECDDCHNKFSGFSEVAPHCNKCKSEKTKRVPKLKIMGFDMVKSSLPQFSKDAMKTAVNIVMTGTQSELADYIESTRLKFMKLPVEDVSCPRGANNLEKWSDDEDTYTKGTPLPVKGVLLFNEYLVKLGLQAKYPPIASSEKIKFVYLKQPNPIHDKVIAFNGKLPEEFGLHKYIDHNKMFELTILQPISKILDPIGWSTEKSYDMEKFFK